MIPFLIIIFGTVLIGWSLEQGRTISFSGIFGSLFTTTYWKQFWEDRNNDNLFFAKSFLSGLLFLILFISRLVFDDYLPLHKLTENGIAHLNNFLFVIFITGIILLIHGIIHSRPTQKIPGLILIGTGLLYLGSLWAFLPRPFNRFFQHILLISTSDLLLIFAAFLFGLGFFLAWKQSEIPSFLTFLGSFLTHPTTGSGSRTLKISTLAPIHNPYRGLWLFLGFGSVIIILILTTQFLFPSFFDRISGFKTPWFEANFDNQIRLSHQKEYVERLRRELDQEPIVNPYYLQNTILMLQNTEKIILNNSTTSFFTSLEKLNEILDEVGFYEFLNIVSIPNDLNRPPIEIIKKEVLCWENKLQFLASRSEEACLKEKEFSRDIAEVNLARNNAMYSIILATLAWVNKDQRKAISILENSIKENSKREYQEIPLLKTWLGYILFATQPKGLKEAVHKPTKLWEESNETIQVIIKDLENELPNKTAQNVIELWNNYQIRVKYYLCYAYAENKTHQWAAIRYSEDLKRTVERNPEIRKHKPEILDAIGWVKIQFHKDRYDVEEARMLLMEAEDIILGWSEEDNEKKWDFLIIVRSHLEKANRILEKNSF